MGSIFVIKFSTENMFIFDPKKDYSKSYSTSKSYIVPDIQKHTSKLTRDQRALIEHIILHRDSKPSGFVKFEDEWKYSKISLLKDWFKLEEIN